MNQSTTNQPKPATLPNQKPAPAKPAQPKIDEDKQRAEWEGMGPPLEDPEVGDEKMEAPAAPKP